MSSQVGTENSRDTVSIPTVDFAIAMEVMRSAEASIDCATDIIAGMFPPTDAAGDIDLEGRRVAFLVSVVRKNLSVIYDEYRKLMELAGQRPNTSGLV